MYPLHCPRIGGADHLFVDEPTHELRSVARTPELSDAGGPRRPNRQLTWPARVRSSDFLLGVIPSWFPPVRNQSWNLPLILPIFLSKALNQFPLLPHNHQVSHWYQQNQHNIQPCVIDQQGIGNDAEPGAEVTRM